MLSCSIILQNTSICCRVQTGERSWAVAQTFLEAKPKTIWRKILENHMDDESFKDIENPGLKEF